jgi:hypothetical protein
MDVAIEASDGTILEIIPHLPFGLDAINQSVTDLVENDVTLPDFQGNYDTWRNEFDKQNAGIFDITIAEVVQAIDETLNQ